MSEQPDARICNWCKKPRRNETGWLFVYKRAGENFSVSITTDPHRAAGDQDACGEECALKLASRLLRQGAEVAA